MSEETTSPWPAIFVGFGIGYVLTSAIGCIIKAYFMIGYLFWKGLKNAITKKTFIIWKIIKLCFFIPMFIAFSVLTIFLIIKVVYFGMILFSYVN